MSINNTIVVGNVPLQSNNRCPEISIVTEKKINKPISIIRKPGQNSDYDNLITSIAFNKNYPNFMASSCNREVSLWNLDFENYQNSRCEITLSINKYVRFIKIHNTDPIMVILCNNSRSIHLWYINYQELSQTVHIARLSGHTEDIYSVAFHPTEPIIATSSQDKTIKLWKYKLKKKLFFSGNYWDVKCKATLKNDKIAFSIEFNENGTIMAAGFGNKLILWRISDIEDLKERNIKKIAELENPASVNSIAFIPFTNFVLVGLWSWSTQSSSNNIVILWDHVSHTQILKINNMTQINNILLNPINNKILAINGPRGINFWELEYSSNVNESQYKATLTNRVNILPFCSFNFHPTNRNIFITGGTHGTIKIWKLNDEGIVIDGQNFENNNNRLVIPPHRQQRQSSPPQPQPLLHDKTIIKVPSEYITQSRTSQECENSRLLYDFIMQQKLFNGKFILKFIGETGIDVGGLTREVFHKILKVYTSLYFEEIEGNSNFLILKKDVNMMELDHNTRQLILVAMAAKSQIFLRIDKRLLDLILSKDSKQFINNSKKNRFKQVFNNINVAIESSNYNNNTKDFLIENKNGRSIKKFKNSSNNNIKNQIKREIRFRRFCIMCGFQTWDEFIRMSMFIQTHWKESGKIVVNNSKKSPKDIFTCELKFDKDSIIERLKINKVISKPGELQRIKELELKNISSEFSDYPFLHLILDFILGENSSDDKRKIFVQYLTASQSSPAILFIELSNIEISSASVGPYWGQPFVAHTCFGSIELFKKPRAFNINKNTLTNLWVEDEIKKGLSSATYL